MNEFDKRMADMKEERRREFWEDVLYWTIEGLCGLAIIFIVVLLLWLPW